MILPGLTEQRRACRRWRPIHDSAAARSRSNFAEYENIWWHMPLSPGQLVRDLSQRHDLLFWFGISIPAFLFSMAIVINPTVARQSASGMGNSATLVPGREGFLDSGRAEDARHGVELAKLDTEYSVDDSAAHQPFFVAKSQSLLTWFPINYTLHGRLAANGPCPELPHSVNVEGELPG